MAVAVRNCLGVDIGSAWMRVAQMEMGKAGPRVVSLIEEPLKLEAGLNEAQRGQRIARQLSELLKRSNIRSKNAVFSVPGQSVFVRRRKLPKAAEERMGQMIRFEARQQIPFPLEQTILQFQVFEEADEAEADVLLVAVKKDYIAQFMRMVNRTGLRPVAISVSSLGLYNFHELNTSTRDLNPGAAKKKKEKKKKEVPAGGKKGRFGFGKKKDDGAAGEAPEAEEPELEDVPYEEILAYVNLGASLMDLAIPKPGEARMIGFTRSVPLAGNDMDRAVRERLGLEDLDAARQIKETKTAIISTQFEIDGNPDQVDMNASEAVTAVADRMISELRRSLDYYISQPDGVAVDKLVLSGGLTRMPFLQSYIEEKMGLPVELAQPHHEQLRMPDTMPETFAPFAISVGLASQGVNIAQNKIDFLPAEIKNVRGLRERPLEIVAMMLMLIVIIALSANIGTSRIQSYNAESAYYDSMLPDIQKQNAEITVAKDRDTKVADAVTKLSKAGSDRLYWMRFMQNLIEKLPPEVLIDDIQMRIDGNVVVRGRASNMAAITQFVNAVKALSEFVPASNPTKVESAAMNSIQQVRDARFAAPVNAFTVTIRTKILNERIRPLGAAPLTPEMMASRANASPWGAGLNPYAPRPVPTAYPGQ